MVARVFIDDGQVRLGSARIVALEVKSVPGAFNRLAFPRLRVAVQAVQVELGLKGHVETGRIRNDAASTCASHKLSPIGGALGRILLDPLSPIGDASRFTLLEGTPLALSRSEARRSKPRLITTRCTSIAAPSRSQRSLTKCPSIACFAAAQGDRFLPRCDQLPKLRLFDSLRPATHQLGPLQVRI